MAGRTQYAFVAAVAALLTVAAYLPDTDRYHVSSFSSPYATSSAGTDGVRAPRGVAWRTRPVTVALSRAALVVPAGSRAARVTTALTLAAAIAAGLTATTVLALGGSTSGAIASALGLASGTAFAAQATTPASSLAEAALCLGVISLLLWKSRTRRRTRSVFIACGVGGVGLVLAAPAIPFYILAGLVMTAFVRYAAPYGRFAATLIIFLVPLLNAAEQHGPVRQAVDQNALAAVAAEVLPAALPANGAVVASDWGVDRVQDYWRIGMPAPPVISPLASDVTRASQDGRAVFAFGASRRHLESRGLHFETERLLETTILLDDYLERLPFRSIVVLGFGPKGASDLGASAPFYGSIGIVGPMGLRRTLERSHTLPVDLRVEVGDPIGSTMLAPVPMRLLADESGVLIDVNRRDVVQKAAAIAIAVVTPSGALWAVHSLDSSPLPAVAVEVPDLQIGRLHVPAGQ